MSDRIDDLLGDDEDDQPDTQVKPQDNQLQAAQRKLAKAEKELEDLRTFKADTERTNRTTSLETVAKEIGINPRHAKFYPAEAETTPEAVRAWALAEEFITAEDAPEPAPAGFTPTVISEGQAPSGKTYSPAEWQSLAMSDPFEAQRILAAGRVNMPMPEVRGSA